MWIRLRDVIHPAFHRVPVFGDGLLVAVLQPDRPGKDHTGITPARRAFAAVGTKQVGRNVGKSSVRSLGVGNVGQKLVREGLNIEVKGSGSPENACVPHPSESFVTLRTIGRDTQKITALSPCADLPHAIDEIARRDQSTGRTGVEAIHDFSGQGSGGWDSGVAGHFHVAKSVEGEQRRVSFFSSAGKDEYVSPVSIAQV